MGASAGLSLADYLDRVASASPTPGGGSVAAIAAALGAALGSMVVSLSCKKSENPRLASLAAECTLCRETALVLQEEDEEAFERVMRVLQLPKDHPARSEELLAGLQEAANVPMAMAKTCLRLMRALRELVDLSSRHSVSDVGAAVHLSLAALRSSLLNVYINGSLMQPSAVKQKWLDQADQVAAEGQALSDQIIALVMSRIRR